MLYGRRLDEAVEHVDGSRYALVHAVAKRARQITLWLTADPAELRAEAAPPPAPGELTSRDPVALAEAEILDGEVKVRWDPEGRADERELLEIDELDADPLLIEGITDEEEGDREGEGDEGGLTPALAQVLETETGAEPEAAEAEAEPEADPEEEVIASPMAGGDAEEIEEIPLDEVAEGEEAGAAEEEDPDA